MVAAATPGLLVLPGWDDDGREKFEDLKAHLARDGWICKRGDLPDAGWSAEQREAVSREAALRRILYDYDELSSLVGAEPIAVLGFSFGAYMGAYLAANRPVQFLVLRSPALYPDEDWSTPKEQLDKRDLKAYRQQVHAKNQNGALGRCSRFTGDVLLIYSEHDEVIPPPVIASYESAFDGARSLTRYTLKGADHTLSDPAWQTEYRNVAVNWLTTKSAGFR